jgi:hypothetical protein
VGIVGFDLDKGVLKHVGIRGEVQYLDFLKQLEKNL